jgi:hypothetical protein
MNSACSFTCKFCTSTIFNFNYCNFKDFQLGSYETANITLDDALEQAESYTPKPENEAENSEFEALLNEFVFLNLCPKSTSFILNLFFALVMHKFLVE